jgi:hypothetical protein
MRSATRPNRTLPSRYPESKPATPDESTGGAGTAATGLVTGR